MIGFKRVSFKYVMIIFLIFVGFILLVNIDLKNNPELPVEDIFESEEIISTSPLTKSYDFYTVKDGENLSIIFEEFKVPLNTAYKVFRKDSAGSLRDIRPGNKMQFTYLDDEIIKIEINCSSGQRIIKNSLTENISIYQRPTNKFIHIILPKPRLFIIGAVHIAQALVSIAKIANYEITLIDPREHFATKKRFPNCTIINEWPDTALANLTLDNASHIITLTHDPKIDDPALITALKNDTGYIGSLGSKKTHKLRCERLKLLGFNKSDLSKIHGPIGLDIKAKTPAEIAISILAEITNFRRL